MKLRLGNLIRRNVLGSVNDSLKYVHKPLILFFIHFVVKCKVNSKRFVVSSFWYFTLECRIIGIERKPSQLSTSKESYISQRPEQRIRAGRHLGLRRIRKKMTTTASAHRVPSLTLTLELIPSCCGHPNVLLTQPLGAETSTRGEWGERRDKDIMEQTCSSPFLSTQAAFPDKWKRSHIRQAI